MVRKIIFLFIVLTAMAPLVYSQWSRVNSWAGGNINCSAVQGGNVILGTQESGVYLSTDSGSSWRPINDGLPGFNELPGHPLGISCLNVRGTNIYAGTHKGVYSLTTIGETWSKIGVGPDTVMEYCIYSLMENDGDIFAGVDIGLYRLSMGDSIWIKLANGLPGDVRINSLYNNGSRIFAGTQQNGIYFSDNNGQSWVNADSGFSYRVVGPVASIGSTIFVGTYGNGLNISSNNGENWINDSPGDIFTDKYVYSIFSKDTSVFISSNYTGVATSTDRGIKWISINEGLPVDPGYYSTSLAANGNKIFLQLNHMFYGYQGLWCRLLNDLLPVEFQKPNNPNVFHLNQNYPNPFNPSTNIAYSLPKNSFVNIKVYDILGREVETLVNEQESAGDHKINFDGSKLTSGTYFYRLSSGDYVQTKKMILMK